MFLILAGMAPSAGKEEGAIAGELRPYENPTTLEEKNLTFEMQQMVSGAGFFARYRHISMPDALGEEGDLYNGVEAGQRSHGSGQLNSESLIYANNSYTNRSWINGAYDEDGEVIEDEEDASSNIALYENGIMSYSPSRIPIGMRYYSNHAIAFDSRIDDSNQIKNRDTMNSISNRILDASGLVIELDANLDVATTGMNLEEDLTDGRAHFAAVQLAGIPRDEEPEEDAEAEAEAGDEVSDGPVSGTAMLAWHDPDFMIEEDYSGTYHISESLTMSFSEEEEEGEEEGWLPCCSGGFFDMSEMDKSKRSVVGIFDCTCFAPATSASRSVPAPQ